MRRASLLPLSVLLGLVLAPYPERPASASCAAPYLEVGESPVLERGAARTVRGRAFVDGCQDSMSCTISFGCQSCEDDDPPPVPAQDVALELRQRGRTFELGTADAGEDGQVTWTVDLPAGVRRGPARLVADGANPVPVRVR
ncbi:hypothetical protein [Nocardioides dongkuii]|uniref:hypothetical protein n=1 Tax=Nocardioides dongkuii TaxID=2760089 RepID=UPI0015FCA5AE|nr:hypothetical protein [Nocardioides dongkuii]